MAGELKPCPFCGSQPEFASSGIEDRDLAKCPKCNDLAWVSRWQTRTPGPATKAMLLEVRCALLGGWRESPISRAPMEAFLAEWADAATPPAPDVTPMKSSYWECCVCGEPVRIADDLRPYHVSGPTNHEAELTDEDKRTLADGLRLTD
jgi:hypothetical protein